MQEKAEDNDILELIDLRGTRCPLTLLKMKQIIVQTPRLQRITFKFDDPGAARDLPQFLSRIAWYCDLVLEQNEYLAYCQKGVSQ